MPLKTVNYPVQRCRSTAAPLWLSFGHAFESLGRRGEGGDNGGLRPVGTAVASRHPRAAWSLEPFQLLPVSALICDISSAMVSRASPIRRTGRATQRCDRRGPGQPLKMALPAVLAGHAELAVVDGDIHLVTQLPGLVLRLRTSGCSPARPIVRDVAVRDFELAQPRSGVELGGEGVLSASSAEPAGSAASGRYFDSAVDRASSISSACKKRRVADRSRLIDIAKPLSWQSTPRTR
jgi:hypothetical protein